MWFAAAALLLASLALMRGERLLDTLQVQWEQSAVQEPAEEAEHDAEAAAADWQDVGATHGSGTDAGVGVSVMGGAPPPSAIAVKSLLPVEPPSPSPPSSPPASPAGEFSSPRMRSLMQYSPTLATSVLHPLHGFEAQQQGTLSTLGEKGPAAGAEHERAMAEACRAAGGTVPSLLEVPVPPGTVARKVKEMEAVARRSLRYPSLHHTSPRSASVWYLVRHSTPCHERCWRWLDCSLSGLGHAPSVV